MTLNVSETIWIIGWMFTLGVTGAGYDKDFNWATNLLTGIICIIGDLISWPITLGIIVKSYFRRKN